jgi:3,4-dihydroxy 2-butanone 4-phosphate synthase/GTP cyclohydrolase II
MHFALVRGRPDPEEPTLVRVQIQNTLSDLFAARTPEHGWPLHEAIRSMAEVETGVMVMLRQPSDSEDVLARMRELQRGSKKCGDEAPSDSRTAQDLRTYGVGAQILTDLGVRRMRVLSAPKRMHGLSGFGMEVVEYVEPGR